MTESDFHTLHVLLGQLGLVVSSVRYDESAFGSWLVVVGTTPAQRVVWDRKDGWLVLAVGTDELLSGERV
jgi:hypothetical protein